MPLTLPDPTPLTREEVHTLNYERRTVPIVVAARRHGVELTPRDFTRDADDYLSLDGMPPGDWLDAMTMD